MSQDFHKNEKKLYAVLGYPISHSLSPLIHQFWIEKNHLRANYLSLPVREDYLEEIFSSLPKMGFHGVNLTIPLKEAALPLCHELSDAAQKIGAVNTILFQEGKILGENTDARGFMDALKMQSDFDAQKYHNILVIGAGGAARSVIYGLLAEKVTKITLYNRTLARAQNLRDFFMSYSSDTMIEIASDLSQAVKNQDLIINSSSCGMNGENDLSIDFATASKQTIAYDLVYKPKKTQFLRDAESAQKTALNGLDMLLYQAAHAFHLWFGMMPEINDELRMKLYAD